METNIPKEELEAFRKLMRTYKQGEKIIIEGQRDNLGLLLLRKGEVEVYKELGTHRELISTFGAINFFGEISLIENKPRTATVQALSDEVIVYSFQKPDLHALLSNPKWGPMLITRVVIDLQERGDQLMDLRRVSNRVVADLERTLNQVNDLRERYDEMAYNITEVMAIILALMSALKSEKAIANSDFINLTETCEKLLDKKLPKIKDKIAPPPKETWDELYRENILSRTLYHRVKK